MLRLERINLADAVGCMQELVAAATRTAAADKSADDKAAGSK